LPVAVVTGFLGSGKTTLIRRLLADVNAADTAVIVNEFGEVGLDHLLLEHATDDIVLLPSGCLCCRSRNDLVRALQSLHDKRERRELPSYARVVIETSGLADPGPILQTLVGDPIRLSRYRLASLLAVVDGQLGRHQIADFALVRLQAMLADRVVISKLDVADPQAAAGTCAALRELGVRRVEPVAPGPMLKDQLFASNARADAEGRGWATGDTTHTAEFISVSRRLPGRFRAQELANGLHLLTSATGEHLLRLKAIANVTECETAMVFHAVQHRFERPRLLGAGLSIAESAFVAIARRIAGERIARELDAVIQHALEAQPQR
jgi:G3E family GTPase